MENLTTTQWSVSKLMDLFSTGRIAVPEIQRDIVWSSDQIKELLDSISLDYPCGSLILWEPRLKDEKLVKEIIRPERAQAFDHLPKYFLIDGQQRVTALATVMLERNLLRKMEPEIETDLMSLFVNLKKFPSDIEAASDADSYKYPWVPMNDIFNGAVKQVKEYDSLPKSEQKKIDGYVQQVRDYQFPVQIIQERDYPTVGRIFSRVNSQGTQLTGAEIHLASIIPYWQGISAKFRQFRSELRGRGYDLDLTFLMRAITATACDVPQIKKLADRVSRREFDQASLDKFWKETKRAVTTVSDILGTGLKLDKTKFFTSKNALIPLVYYTVRSRGKGLDRKGIMRYFIVSQLGGHYSGAGETVLRRDIRYLSVPGEKPTSGLANLLGIAEREAKQEYRGLKVRPSQITGFPSKNVILLLMYVVMRQRGACDFGSGGASLDAISAEEDATASYFPI